MFKFKPYSRETGQVGVIILLTMAGMLTIGLSLASRTTQELFLSGQEADSARVFNAAEVGIEEALSQDLDFTGETYNADIGSIENVNVNYSIDKVNSLETRLFEGISVSLNVEGVVTGEGLQIDWSKEDSCAEEDLASLIALIYFDDAGTTRVRYQTMAACDNGDGFELASTIDENGYHRRYSLALETGDFLVRIKPIYADTHVRITGDGTSLPVQYYTIRSEASNTQGDETRAVEVQRTLSSAPSMFDYALFSGTTIIK